MQINKETSVAFTGYRLSKLQKKLTKKEDFCQLEQKIYHAIEQLLAQGYDTFLCGMGDGFDLMCAEQVLNFPNAKLIAVVPYFGHQRAYTSIAERASEIIYLDDKYLGNYQFIVRNDFLINNSSFLVCYYDGEKGGTHYTYQKAQKVGMPTLNLCENKLPQQLSLGFAKPNESGC